MVSESKFDIQDCLGFVKLTTTAVFIACARQRCCGWFVSTTASRRNDISVVNVRRSSSSSCKNCNCYNLNLQREFPFHAPSLFWKSLKGEGGGEYFCSTTTKINPNSLQWNFLGFLLFFSQQEINLFLWRIEEKSAKLVCLQTLLIWGHARSCEEELNWCFSAS